MGSSDYSGFMSRLAHDQNGNILAMTAAAVIPMMGLVGGSLDAARLYTVKSRLQAACDAGALAGRRVMGSGRWTDNNGRPNTTAISTFDLNFASNFFGSENRTRTFTEADGTVTGSASADVPMTLMRIFGIPTKTVNVSCEGQMRIPNTDVMFVLDNSGSMKETIPGDATGLRKMAGLQLAIRCFYEALSRENITDVSAEQCGATSDPTGDLSSQVQLRFGFVNYDNMVNVGRLLPNDYFVDRWTYQSREATTENVHTWTAGTPATPDWTPTSSTPDKYSNPALFSSSWSVVSGLTVTLADGSTLPKQATQAGNETACAALNTYGSFDRLVGVQETYGGWKSITYTPTNNDPPVFPAVRQDLSATGDRTATVTLALRYKYFNNGCWMQKANFSGTSNDAKWTQTGSGTSQRTINWATQTRIAGWTYKPREFDISGLKTATVWPRTVALDVGETSRTVKLSGSSTDTTIKIPATIAARWEGCIEERKTFKNVDGNPADDWLNYPSSPSDAIDMDIDIVPSTWNDDTRWKPILHNIVWGRKETLTDTTWSGNYTTAWVSAAPSISGPVNTTNVGNNSGCVTASRKLQSYDGRNGNQSASDFSDYVSTIAPHYNTYHDIGLLWGARLMSPTGIFRSENETTSGGAQIQRHMIFMTDGATANEQNNYASYGLEWWDRRQVDPSGLTESQYEAKLVANNNARSNALCTAIKNKNITLWVIYYGTSDTATKTRLTNCATSATYFFEAKNTLSLIAKFREIADRISNLRLTQ
ncbi:TadE/TadG family type IV pilus assembly protein [Sphingobium agri]|uniref:Tad domain-containing protein n=1 Tax=Sphingobium agri TaxID=2933566 RepID=A0ABT0DWB7_9SPHN|nr:TadE/TadG family type IV pilus assembly protein [Sphingobium agri]MCK0531407.1 Tad domain-containing protein [Sphingobium agri]